MRPLLRFAAKALAGLLALQVVLLLLLVAAQAVPNRPIVAHLATAVQTGDYGTPYAPDGFGGQADRFTECVVLGYGVSSPGDPRGLWYRATGGPRLSSCEDGAGEIRHLAAGGTLLTPATYFRYWNGYSVLTRPALAALGVPGVRLVTAGLLAAATVAAFAAVARRAGRGPALALLVPLAAATNAAAMPSTAFSHGIALAAVAAGVALTAVAARRGWRGAAVGTGASGALFCYVDLLTVPPMAWALCAAVAGAVAFTARPLWWPTARVVLAAGIAWPAAFALTWISRWVVAALVHGPEVFSRVAEVGRFRVNGDNGAMVSQALGAGLRANWQHWLDTTATARPLLVVAAVVALAAVAVAVARRGPAALATAAVLAAPALVVPVWYEVMSNHSQIHAFFTYRSLAAAVGVVVMACLVVARRSEATALPAQGDGHAAGWRPWRTPPRAVSPTPTSR
ncbi:hypothetical protein CLV92_104185 [Kineococcus xinjiangensis]|uniref:Glycosyltransferase RgtA/B/C/D-like domain-containing protein n=1 Tax=Kineococcus xinjiangensis TaxID=512762 RepID=A0A2S6ISY4_9ACTN|nr:hypothetical protein [Kineococcus xinjiangensis]PPK97364.1 hypothetical protein CLV92_104185 [Kineococcus xinjiangensis]